MSHRMLVRIFVFLCLWVLSNGSYSHEGRPVFIEVLEKDNGRYSLRWKTPPVVETGSEPEIHLLAEHCKLESGRTSPALTGKKSYRCSKDNTTGDLQVKLEIVLDYPKGNPSLSTLVKFETVHGDIRSFFQVPGKERILLSAEVTALSLAKRYLTAGITHILSGYDHLLFVLCLMQIARTGRRLLIVVSAFTLAHSLTLLASTLAWTRIRIDVVETLIALSVVMLLAELLREKLTGQRSGLVWRYPTSVAAIFGLLHGFGFASALGEMGLPTDLKVPALAYFNIGVELGQILFIAATILLATLIQKIYRWFSRPRDGFNTQDQRALVTSTAVLELPVSLLYLTGLVAAYWFIRGLADIFLG